MPNEREWRCFQCGEVFTDEKAALDHFGRYTVLDPPLCCDRSLATFEQVLRDLRETQIHAQVLYQQKAELERELVALRRKPG